MKRINVKILSNTADNLYFFSDYRYKSREDKPIYVWAKYSSALDGKILDVGADQCGLKKVLPKGSEYIGIGIGKSVDMKIDLEKEELPFKSNSFDCVLCLDVLEHLDNIHDVFDEVCRVTKKYLIISLPNPWAGFMDMLKNGYYKYPNTPIKFYHLPDTPPQDRHKWFYGAHEAERFIAERGKMNNMNVIQIDRERLPFNFRRIFYKLMLKMLIHKDVHIHSLWSGNIWGILKKEVF